MTIQELVAAVRQLSAYELEKALEWIAKRVDLSRSEKEYAYWRSVQKQLAQS